MAQKSFAFALILFTALTLMCVSVAAQGTTSRVTGVVTDTTGAAVPGATVTLTNEATNASRTTESNDSGDYVFDLIQPGNYTVTVEKAGFKKFVTTKNNVQVNIPATINIPLEVGDVSAVVSVESTAALVTTATSGNTGSTLQQREIESLPIVGARGRNPFDLLNVQPGVAVGANTGGGIHVHGSRDRAYNFTLDGIDINESTAGGSNFTPLRPNPESIQELQIVTGNFTAELGRSPGAQVSLTTRSGTNQIRGNLFEFYQTPDFHANEWEFNKQRIAKRQFVQHIYGGSVGGPIFNPGFGEGTKAGWLRDRAFFFVNLQFLRAAETRLQNINVYTGPARAGIYRYVRNGRNNPAGTPTNTTFPTGPAVNPDGSPRYPACTPEMPSTAICTETYNIATGRPITLDPAIINLLATQGLPNDFTGGDGLNLALLKFTAPQIEKQYDLVMRYDVKINDNNQVYFRYAQGEQNTFGDIVNGGLQRVPGGANWVDTYRKPMNWALNYRWSPSSRFANEFIVGLNKFSFRFEQPEPDPTVPFVLNNPTDFRQNFAYNARSARTWQFVDNITYDASPHTIKFGINFRFGNQFDDRSSAGGQIEPQVFFTSTNSSFTGWALPTTTGASPINSNDLTRLRNTINDLIGRIGSARQGFVVSGSNPGVFAPGGTRWNWTAYYPEYDFYVQDTWRLRTNLTVDLGLRWEIKMSPSSKDLPILTPAQPFTVGAPGSNTLRWEEGDLYKNDYNNFSPSIGVAWDPFKSGKTSVRANYRLSYDRFPSQVFANFVYQSAPGNTFQSNPAGLDVQNLLIRNGIPNLTPTQTPNQLRQNPPFSTSSIVAVDPNIQFPESHQWFAGIQRELWAGNVLEINYIGRRGVHLFGAYDVNQVNIHATDPRCNQTFLQAFIAIRGGSTNECLTNFLFANSNATNAGTTTFLGISAVTTALGQGAPGNAALAVSQHTTGGVQTIGRATHFNNPFFFQQHPQFSGGLNVLETNDLSRYNALEFIVRKRFAAGLSYQLSYTYSISKDTRSFDPTFATANRTGIVGGQIVTPQSASSTPYNIKDRSLNYSWSDFDRRHVWQGYGVYELPFGRGRMFGSDMPRVLDWIVGGWQVSGLFNLGSGRPYTANSGITTFGNVVNSTANCNGCPRDMGGLTLRNGIYYWFTAEDQARFTVPAPGELGNTPRNYFIGPRAFNVDGSLSKKFRFTERWSFDLRVDAKNLTNTPTFFLADAAMTLANPVFGQINNSVTSFSRRIQFSGKLNF